MSSSPLPRPVPRSADPQRRLRLRVLFARIGFESVLDSDGWYHIGTADGVAAGELVERLGEPVELDDAPDREGTPYELEGVIVTVLGDAAYF